MVTLPRDQVGSKSFLPPASPTISESVRHAFVSLKPSDTLSRRAGPHVARSYADERPLLHRGTSATRSKDRRLRVELRPWAIRQLAATSGRCASPSNIAAYLNMSAARSRYDNESLHRFSRSAAVDVRRGITRVCCWLSASQQWLPWIIGRDRRNRRRLAYRNTNRRDNAWDE